MFSLSPRDPKLAGQDEAVGASIWRGQKGERQSFTLKKNGKPVAATRLVYKNFDPLSESSVSVLLTTIPQADGTYLHVRQRADQPETWRKILGYDD